MRTFILFFALMFTVVASAQQAQKIPNNGYLIKNLNLASISGTDTAFYYVMDRTVNKYWSQQTRWTGLEGGGSISLWVTDFDDLTGWVQYTGSLSTSITDSVGSGGWEDDVFAWEYLMLVLTKDSITDGRLDHVIEIK